MRRAVLGALVFGALVGIGCGDDEDEGATTPPPETGTIDPVRRHEAEQIPPHQLAELAMHHDGRVDEVRGAASKDGAPVAAGDTVSGGEKLTTGDDGHLTVDLLTEMRIELGPGSEATVGTLVDGEMYLHAGVMRGELPPIGGGARPPLRIGTPSGSVVLESAGDIMVAVLPSGDAWIVLYTGGAAVTRGDATGEGGERRLARTTIIEGQAIVLGRSEIATPTDAPERVEAGWAAAAQLVSATSAPTAAERAALISHARERYDEAAAWLTAELARGAALADEQREAVGSDPERARELTREIVVYSQRRSRLRKLALGRFEQLASAEGFGEGSAAAERLERATEMFTD